MDYLNGKKLSIDKSNWAPAKFGDVVAEPKESVKDIEGEGIEHVVGLEHIDSENIHLRGSAGIEESTTFTKKFSKGDVLFGRRRAYLKKAALANFSGICSGDITVMRVKDSLIPDLLPFIVQNDKFFDYAVKHSAGGLSPRVKFKDLANYEFLLPPEDQQAQLAKLLWAMDEVIERGVYLLKTAKVHYEVEKNNLVLKGIDEKTVYSETLKLEKAINWNETTIGDLLECGYIKQIQDGNHGEIHPKSIDYSEDGVPFIMANTLLNGQINFKKAKRIPKEKTDKLRIGFSLSGDVLLSHKGTVGQVAIVPENIKWPYLMLTPQVTYYRVNSKELLNKFLYYVFTSNYFQLQLTRLSSQSTRAYVGITAQKTLKVVIPDLLQIQGDILNILSEIESNLNLINDNIDVSKSLQKSLINQIF